MAFVIGPYEVESSSSQYLGIQGIPAPFDQGSSSLLPDGTSGRTTIRGRTGSDQASVAQSSHPIHGRTHLWPWHRRTMVTSQMWAHPCCHISSFDTYFLNTYTCKFEKLLFSPIQKHKSSLLYARLSWASSHCRYSCNRAPCILTTLPCLSSRLLSSFFYMS